ncbi:MAG: leucine-rich repeat protein, partial [Clostridia bacterium]|nr:leucine-rich repeat protein [Clostridia bacterium]
MKRIYRFLILLGILCFALGICGTAYAANAPIENEAITSSEDIIFSTTEEAVFYLRERMKLRDISVSVRLQGFTSVTAQSLFYQACEHTGNPKEGDYLKHNLYKVSLDEAVGNASDGTIYTEFTYTFQWLSNASMEAEIDIAVRKVLDELNLYHASNYEKIRGVYDWVTENVDYDFDNLDDDTYLLKHSTYAALIQKNAVCQGYATLYYRLMLELGVDCRYISGDADGERHGWNIVYLDGKYYNMDATWDRDLMGHYRHFLCTDNNFPQHDRDSQYTTAEFHSKYPMAIVPYVFHVAASGTINQNMAWVLDKDTGTLTVSGKGAIPSYRFSNAPWYPYRESVKKIVVSEGITEVGERAFYWCVNATSVELPNSLIAIREYGFNNLQALQSITLPPNLQILEFCAFSECRGLKTITLPDSVHTVGTSCFSLCYSLREATLSAGMKTVPNSMFFGCHNLRRVTLPEGITTIESTAFSDCYLTSFTIPKTLTQIGTSAFSGCKGLKSFTVEAGNPMFKSIDGVLFSANGEHLISYPAGKSTFEYFIPYGTKYIDYGAFRDADWLYYVNFPATLLEIGNYSFSWCDNLRSLTFPSNITKIEDSAFRSCIRLTSVTFYNQSVILEEGGVFAECDSLVSITLPTQITEIPGSLFYGCAKLKDVTIPATASKIGSAAFMDCDSLVSITIPGSVKSIGRQAFDFCNRLETVILQEGVVRLEDYCFRNLPSLRSITVPQSVTSIGKEFLAETPYVTMSVSCGSYAYNYAVNNRISYSANHVVNLFSHTVQPTCTGNGYHYYRCKCGSRTSTVVISPTGHTSVIVSGKPATCTESGLTDGTVCSVCNKILVSQNIIPPKDHAWGEGIVTKEPTEVSPGIRTYTCAACGETKTEEIPMLEHKHQYISVVTSPTCTEKGFTTHTCKSCGDFYTDTYINAKGHMEVTDKGKAPTCTESGLTDGKHCSVCSEVLQKQEVIPAKEHSLGVWTQTKAPTCTEKGEERRTCADCSHFETREISAKG